MVNHATEKKKILTLLQFELSSLGKFAPLSLTDFTLNSAPGSWLLASNLFLLSHATQGRPPRPTDIV